VSMLAAVEIVLADLGAEIEGGVDVRPALGAFAHPPVAGVCPRHAEGDSGEPARFPLAPYRAFGAVRRERTWRELAARSRP
jgi:hypothetical protein